MKIFSILLIFPCIPLSAAFAESFRVPSFLPGYYASAFRVAEVELSYRTRSTDNGAEQYLYQSTDGALAVRVENLPCERPTCAALFGKILNYITQILAGTGGEFHVVTQREIEARFSKGKDRNFLLVYVLPSSIQVWTYGANEFVHRSDSVEGEALKTRFEALKTIVNRQRYEQAKAAGNVAMGLWAAESRQYALKLIANGAQADGLSVLKALLATSPFDYESHMDFAEHTTDVAAARASAQTVIENSESRELRERAAKILDVQLPSLEAIPLLGKNETGLQLILIPLPPCDVSILPPAARTFEQITNIPVKIRRLPDPWQFEDPERVPFQRDVQNALTTWSRRNIDFAGWDKSRYLSELWFAAKSQDPLSQFWADQIGQRINDEAGQYDVSPYVDRLSSILEAYRSGDNRTLYVGVTGANIFSGDTNYLFSLHTARAVSQVSILSYYMMQAENLREEFESKQRLTERIAKELVPASLKSLGIPRPADPRDPYSYSSGVGRLDQKTLNLSQEVKDALQRFRD